MDLSTSCQILDLCVADASNILFEVARMIAKFREQLSPLLLPSYEDLTANFRKEIKRELRLLSIETYPLVLLDEKIASAKNVLTLHEEMLSQIQQSSLFPDAPQKLSGVYSLVQNGIAVLHSPIVDEAIDEYLCLV